MPSSNASPFIWQVKCHRVELVEEDDQIKMKSVLIAMVATRSFGKSTYCVMFTLLQRWGRQSAELCGGTLSSVMAILVHLPEWDWGACLVNTSSHWSSSEFALALLYLATLEIRWMWSNITRSITLPWELERVVHSTGKFYPLFFLPDGIQPETSSFFFLPANFSSFIFRARNV